MYLRPYGNGDLDAIHALDRVCFAAPFRFSRAMMRRAVEAPGAVVLLACDVGADGAERVLGFCAAQLEKARGNLQLGYISTLDVAPESRGQGIGQALMRAVEQEVARAGGECIVLHVFVENSSAVRLYEGLGYERVGQEEGFYGDNLDAWVYRKELQQSSPRLKG